MPTACGAAYASAMLVPSLAPAEWEWWEPEDGFRDDRMMNLRLPLVFMYPPPLPLHGGGQVRSPS